jgi:ABC-2 type transport system permease protein
LTRQLPEAPVVFAAAVLLLGVTMLGFGLFVGVLFRNANQLNTWAGLYLLPVIAPAFMVGLPLPDEFDTALLLLPTSQAMRLLVNGMSGAQLFSNVALSWLVLAAWGVAGYGLLSWRLSQQRA